LVLLLVQARLIWLLEAAVAVRPLGAAGTVVVVSHAAARSLLPPEESAEVSVKVIFSVWLAEAAW
jgi:hypothetical protein